MGSIDYRSLLRSGLPTAAPITEHGHKKYDFAVGHPDPHGLPLEALAQALQEGLDAEGSTLAWYPHPLGYAPLRDYVAQKLKTDRGIQARADDILLGSGSSQPIHMVIESLVASGDIVLCEEFTYVGTLNAIRRFGGEPRAVTCDELGIVPAALQQALQRAAAEQRSVKLVYSIPTFQNPLGTTADANRRADVLEVTSSHGIPILEDDCYVDLRYEGEVEPAIRALDEGNNVIYVGSFSKIIGPGMRMGYVVAPTQLLPTLSSIKSGGGANQFVALALHRLAVRGDLQRHIAASCDTQREKRAAMYESLEAHFGASASWSQPHGGIYLWIELEDRHVDTEALVPAAQALDVGFTAGRGFHAEGVAGRHCLRLCFGYNTPAEIREGVGRLASAFADAGVAGIMARPAGAALGAR
jgi:2-aminoadipate transaminase